MVWNFGVMPNKFNVYKISAVTHLNSTTYPYLLSLSPEFVKPLQQMNPAKSLWGISNHLDFVRLLLVHIALMIYEVKK